MTSRPTLHLTSTARVCARIAQHIIAPPTNTSNRYGSEHTTVPPCTFGEIHLHPHQIAALHRIHAACTTFGGALLCDDVGLGKTYVALATAATYHDICIVAPAVLRPMWHDALTKTSLHATFISIESLSSAAPPFTSQFDFVIVDEAHHARTPSTNRYTALTALCATATTLLLSATPVHNRYADVTALLALIVGDRASTLTNAELSRLVIRRTLDSTQLTAHIPHVNPTEWLRPEASSHIVDALLALPPALPPSDGTPAQTLLIHTLVRQYASSEHALRTALRRRLARAHALCTTLREGHYPTTHDLQLWSHGDDATQLAFPTLTTPTRVHDTTHLQTIIDTHAAALSTLLESLPAESRADHHRASLIRQIRYRHPNQRIVAFSQYAATIHTFFHILRTDPHVASLTSHSARIATGPITRTDVLARFTLNPHDASHEKNQITLLLTTDLLSEGVNLQHASVLLHLDLPWTPAKLTQRVGRLARIGSSHQEIFVYGFLPSHRAEAVIRATSTLQTKARIADKARDIPECTEAIRTTLMTWSHHMRDDTGNSVNHIDTTTCETAIISSDTHAFLALCIDHAQPLLVAGRRQRQTYTGSCAAAHKPARTQRTQCNYTISTDPRVIWQTLRRIHVSQITHATPLPTSTIHAAIEGAHQSLRQWIESENAASDAGTSHPISDSRLARQKRQFMKNVSALSTTPTLIRRASLAPLLAQAYRTFSSSLSLGFEQSFYAKLPLSERSIEDALTLRLSATSKATDPFSRKAQNTCLIALLLLLAPPG